MVVVKQICESVWSFWEGFSGMLADQVQRVMLVKQHVLICHHLMAFMRNMNSTDFFFTPCESMGKNISVPLFQDVRM